MRNRQARRAPLTRISPLRWLRILWMGAFRLVSAEPDLITQTQIPTDAFSLMRGDASEGLKCGRTWNHYYAV